MSTALIIYRSVLDISTDSGMKVITDLRGKPLECESTHHAECPCIFGLVHRNQRQYYLNIMERWKEIVLKVSNMDEFNREVNGFDEISEII